MKKNVNIRSLLIIFVCFSVSILLYSELFGCSVPVFRYALERWPSDPYIIKIFHKGKITKKQKQVIDYYRKFSNPQQLIILTVVDLNSKPLLGDALRISQNENKQKLPIVFVKYPIQSNIKGLAGVYPLDMRSAVQVMESPTGRELARRLLKDDSAIYMQIDGVDSKKNSKSEQLVRKAVKQMNRELKLPHEQLEEGEVLDEESMSYDANKLKIKFSFLRISRKNSADKAFIEILLNSEKGLKKIKGPLVFPVYGRARALFAFSGDGINIENMKDAGAFLTGSCSCEVKAQNPGLDLLVPVAWDDFVHYEVNVDDELPPLQGITTTILEEQKSEALPVANIDLNKSSKVNPKSSTNQLLLNLIIAIVALIGLFAIVAISIKKRGN